MLLELANATYTIIACTGRSEAQRKPTEAWLRERGIDHFETILMRPNGDNTPDHQLKLRLVDEHFGSREAALEAVDFILDDRDRVVEAFRDAGFTCWQVQAGSY
jgi:hypothetical protein